MSRLIFQDAGGDEALRAGLRSSSDEDALLLPPLSGVTSDEAFVTMCRDERCGTLLSSISRKGELSESDEKVKDDEFSWLPNGEPFSDFLERNPA